MLPGVDATGLPVTSRSSFLPIACQVVNVVPFFLQESPYETMTVNYSSLCFVVIMTFVLPLKISLFTCETNVNFQPVFSIVFILEHFRPVWRNLVFGE
jgi:hypothetical protein